MVVGVLRRQLAAGGEGGSGGERVAPPSVRRVLQEPGEALPAGIRGKFEGRLGVDLSPVRLHTGPDATRAAASVNARAFAFGHQVHLGGEAPVPTSQGGKRLLAHDVAHVAMGHGDYSLRRDGPTAPATGDALTAADIINDRLEGYTSANDSEDILSQFRGRAPGQILSIMQEVKSRGPQHRLDAAGMVDWLLGGLTEENRGELRGLLARSVSQDMSCILVLAIKDRLDGYTSEADSTEILAAFSSFSSGISTLLSGLETAMAQDEAAMNCQLFGDLDRVNAERLRQLFFAQGGSRGIDYAATWTAGKIESLLAGWSGLSDSTDILWNLQSTPVAVRPLVCCPRDIEVVPILDVGHPRGVKGAGDARNEDLELRLQYAARCHCARSQLSRVEYARIACADVADIDRATAVTDACAGAGGGEVPADLDEALVSDV